MVQERCALSLQDPPMLVLGSHPMDCEARDWEDVYYLLYMTLHAWPGGQRPRLWGAFLSGRLDRSRDAVRCDLIASQVKKAAKAFARQWRREDSVLDVRILAVLVERDDPSHREHWTYMTGAGQVLGASEQHHSERAFQLAQMSDDAFAALVDEDWQMLNRLRAWSWARQWHALVGRDYRDYSSVDARVDAVRHLGADCGADLCSLWMRMGVLRRGRNVRRVISICGKCSVRMTWPGAIVVLRGLSSTF